MKTDDKQKQILSDVGEEILIALNTVARAAQHALAGGVSEISATALANPTNTMVGAGRAEKNIAAINSEVRDNLRRLIREPFVARVEVEWDRGDGPSIENRTRIVKSRARVRRSDIYFPA